MWSMNVWKKTQAITMTSWWFIWSSMVWEFLSETVYERTFPWIRHCE